MLALRYTPMTDDYMIHGELVLKNDVSQLKDSINNERIDGKNILTLKKKKISNIKND